MESTPAQSHSILNSPRAQRRFMWISGGVFVVGLIVFLAVFVFRGSPGHRSPISDKAAKKAPKLVKAAPDPAAYKVARKFIETAPLRKNLDVAYPLVNRDIKGGMTKKQWEKGNIAVLPYPARN